MDRPCRYCANSACNYWSLSLSLSFFTQLLFCRTSSEQLCKEGWGGYFWKWREGVQSPVWELHCHHRHLPRAKHQNRGNHNDCQKGNSKNHLLSCTILTWITRITEASCKWGSASDCAFLTYKFGILILESPLCMSRPSLLHKHQWWDCTMYLTY